MLAITSFSPQAGPSGTPVTLNVTGIPANTPQGQVTVKLGTLVTPIVSLTAAGDKLVVRIPTVTGTLNANFGLDFGGGHAASTARFAVTNPVPPKFRTPSPFSPTNATTGQKISVWGSNLDKVSTLTLVGTGVQPVTQFSKISGGQLTFNVPNTTQPGKYYINIRDSANPPVSSQPAQLTVAKS